VTIQCRDFRPGDRPARIVQRVLIVSGLGHLIAKCPSMEAAIAAAATTADVPA
jgi:hypothetical protein